MKQKVLLIARILFGLMFLNAGLNKFFNYMPMPENLPEEVMNAMFALMQLVWLLPLIAIAEIIGGVLFIFPRTSALGAIVIFPVMVGIVLHHSVFDPSGLIFVLVLLLINLWVILENKEKYLPMINK